MKVNLDGPRRRKRGERAYIFGTPALNFPGANRGPLLCRRLFKITNSDRTVSVVARKLMSPPDYPAGRVAAARAALGGEARNDLKVNVD